MSEGIPKEFVDIFVQEAEESFEQWEQLCFRMEKGETTPDLMRHMFRLAHNMKGSSRSVGIEGFGAFIHKVEDFITVLRNNPQFIDHDCCIVLLTAQKIGVEWVQILKETGEEKTVPESEILLRKVKNRLNKFQEALAGGSAAAATAAPAAATAAPAAATAAPAAAAISQDPPTPQSSGEHPSSVAHHSHGHRRGEHRKHAHNVAIPVAHHGGGKRENGENKTASGNDVVRVKMEKIDQIISLMGEISINQNIISRSLQKADLDSLTLESVKQLEKTISQVQQLSMELRMVPLDKTFQKMERIVIDLRDKLDKKVDFEAIGQEVELDKIIVDALSDPLTHLMRNAMDHGIEMPADREKAGKHPVAHVFMKARVTEGEVEISIGDDGRGLHRDRILAKAVEKGLVGENDNLTDNQVYALLFAPGFSTKEEITDISGRGVGLDVVNSMVNDLKGRIEIETTPGHGTTFKVYLPLSLAIIRGLVVTVENDKYVIPSGQLHEVLNFQKHKVEGTHTGARRVDVRGQVFPVVGFDFAFRNRHRPKETEALKSGLVITNRGENLSFWVDEILEEQNLVLRDLSQKMQGMPGVLGGAILSTGEPALVLNMQEICELWRKHVA